MSVLYDIELCAMLWSLLLYELQQWIQGYGLYLQVMHQCCSSCSSVQGLQHCMYVVVQLVVLRQLGGCYCICQYCYLYKQVLLLHAIVWYAVSGGAKHVVVLEVLCMYTQCQLSWYGLYVQHCVMVQLQMLMYRIPVIVRSAYYQYMCLRYLGTQVCMYTARWIVLSMLMYRIPVIVSSMYIWSLALDVLRQLSDVVLW